MDRVRRRTLYITGEDVKTASAFLQGIDREKLRKYYRFKTMVNLGCHIPKSETEESFFEIMVEMVESLKTFYKKAADENKWIIYYYTVVPEKPTLFDRFLGKKLTNYYHDRANR